MLILTGGRLGRPSPVPLQTEEFNRVIAVDGGLKGAKELGLVPDVIVGDFDSVDPAVLAFYRKMEHIVWEVHQPEKGRYGYRAGLKAGHGHEQEKSLSWSHRRTSGSYDR
ncbi:MAG: hypothetical protein ACLVFN_05195 [Enterocloster sp.]